MYLSKSEIKRLLKNWYFYKASISTLEDGGQLKKKLDAIERAINALADVNKTIMRMRFYDCAEMETIAERVFMSRQAVYKRIENVVENMVYLFAGIG